MSPAPLDAPPPSPGPAAPSDPHRAGASPGGEPGHGPTPDRSATLADRLDDVLLAVDRWRWGGWSRHRRVGRPVAWGLALAAALAAVALGWRALARPEPPPVEELLPMAVPSTSAPGAGPSPGTTGAEVTEPEGGSEPAPPLVVHVVGAVRRPGLVTVPPGSRVSDAIAGAGGPTAEADVHRLNLAAPIGDGMQIEVPALGDEPSGPLIRGGGGAAPSSADAGDGQGEGAEPAPVDVNRADEAQLESLPGIGPTIAAAIVAHRTDHGPFLTVEDLLAVPGIGPARLEAIRDLVTV